MFDNPQFKDFRARLEARGVTLWPLWTISTRDEGDDNLTLFALFVGERLSSTIIVQDYGEEGGFGLWRESGTDETDIEWLASTD